MRESAGTAIFATTGLTALVLTVVAVKRASSRPSTVLLGTGIDAIVLAAAYVTIASLLRPSQAVGLWATGLATSVPTALSSAGTTAVSVWVALWAADQSRKAMFIADEAALIRDLDGVLRLLERRSIWFRNLWLGSTSPVVRAGEELMTKFRLGDVDDTIAEHDLFGESGIAQSIIKSLFTGFLDRTVQDETDALRDATRRLVALEMQTGLSMQPLLGDVALLGVVTSCLESERSSPAAASDNPRQTDSRVKSLLRLQFLVVLATCYWRACRDLETGLSGEANMQIFLSSHGSWWQAIYNNLTERPSNLAMELRQRYGRSPLTGYEALKEIPEEELRESDYLWRSFVLASFRRNDVRAAIRLLDPERTRPRSFSELSHMTFWAKVREVSRLDDVSAEE